MIELESNLMDYEFQVQSLHADLEVVQEFRVPPPPPPSQTKRGKRRGSSRAWNYVSGKIALASSLHLFFTRFFLTHYQQQRTALLHELEMTKKALEDATAKNKEKVAKLERKYFEEKLRLQKEVAVKLTEMKKVRIAASRA